MPDYPTVDPPEPVDPPGPLPDVGPRARVLVVEFIHPDRKPIHITLTDDDVTPFVQSSDEGKIVLSLIKLDDETPIAAFAGVSRFYFTDLQWEQQS